MSDIHEPSMRPGESVSGGVLTQELVRHIFIYEAETGRLINRINRSRTAKAGAEAGTEFVKRKSGKPYRSVTIKGKSYLTHRVIWLYMFGSWPEQIDHDDGNGINNRLDNLNNVSHSRNAKNQRLNTKNTSGRIGVSWYSRDQLWRAQINKNGKRTSLGYFNSFEDAVHARHAAEVSLGYHPNHGKQRPL